MTEQQIKRVREVVDQCFNPRDIPKLLDFAYFPSLVQKTCELLREGGATALSSELELHCITALCVLGPRGKGVPPVRMCEQLTRVVSQYASERLERTLEFAVAYGCGKWRDVTSRDQGWAGQWARAIDVMSLAMVPAVREVNVWLSNNVECYHEPGFWGSSEGRDVIRMDAKLLALQLLNPFRPLHIGHDESFTLRHLGDGAVYELAGDKDSGVLIPAGARLVFFTASNSELIKMRKGAIKDRLVLKPGVIVKVLVRDEETRVEFEPKIHRVTLKENESAVIHGPADLERWRCACCNRNCVQRHRLDGWDPAREVSLWSFLASAVKGMKNLVTKSFTTASYYPLLALEGSTSGKRVRSVRVLKMTCNNPDCAHCGEAKSFEDGKCRFCGAPFDPAAAKAIEQELLITVSEEGVYVPVKVQRCNASVDQQGEKTKCDNYYAFSDDPICPICGHSGKGGRPTYLWIRRDDARIFVDNDLDAVNEYSTKEEPSQFLEGIEAVAERLGIPQCKGSGTGNKAQSQRKESENPDG